jgi:hypothetical protein
MNREKNGKKRQERKKEERERMKEETIKRENEGRDNKERKERRKRDNKGKKRQERKKERANEKRSMRLPSRYRSTRRPPTHSANINYNYKYYSANLKVNTKLTLVPPISLSLDPPGRPPIAAHTAAPLPGMSIFLFFLPLTAKNLLVN